MQIAGFKPFDRVLVRNNVAEKWQARYYSSYESWSDRPYHTTSGFVHTFIYCIPYEGNEDKLGKVTAS